MHSSEIYLPKDLDALLNETDDLRTQAFFKKRLEELASDPIILKKKNFSGKIVFTLNMNFGSDKHRLLFAKVTVNNKSAFVLQGIAWNHNYSKALNQWAPKAIVGEALENYRSLQCQLDEVDSRPTVKHLNKWCTLTRDQHAVINTTQLPKIVYGPPGSGKTLSAECVIQQHILAKLVEEEAEAGNEQSPSIDLVYITKNPLLKQSMEISVRHWIDDTLGERNHGVSITFLTFDELNHWSRRGQHTALSKHNLMDTLENLIKATKCKLAKNALYQEFTLNAHLLNQDRSQGVLFENSHYIRQGVNQSLLNEEEKRIAFQIFFNLQASLETGKTYYPPFAPLGSVPSSSKFPLAVVDEAHQASTQELINALDVTHNYQVAFFGDTWQKDEIPITSLSLLKPFLYQKIPLVVQELKGSLRLKPVLARLANELVLLMHHLNQGKIDSFSYASLSAVAKEGENQGQISLCFQAQEDFKNFGKSSSSAALVFNEFDREQAALLTHSHNVFTIEEAQGLEFEGIFIYLSEQTLSAFKTISKRMNELEITESRELLELHNYSPNKSQGLGSHFNFKMLSQFYIALTRTYGNVTIYVEKENLHDIFQQWLRYRCATETIKTMAIKESSADEWLAWTHELLYKGLKKQAIEILVNSLHLSPQNALAYTELSWAQHKKNTSELVEWNDALQKFQEEKASRAKPDLCFFQAPVRQVAPPSLPDPCIPSPPQEDDKETTMIKGLLQDFSAKRLAVVLNIFTMDRTAWTHPAMQLLYEALLVPEKKDIFIHCLLDRGLLLFKIPLTMLVGLQRKFHTDDFDCLVRIKERFNRYKNGMDLELVSCIAAYNNDSKTINLCHQIGFDLNTMNSAGLSALHIAAERAHLDLLKQLKKLNVDLDNSLDKGPTPLFKACQNGHTSIAQQLLQWGADYKKLTYMTQKQLLNLAQNCSPQIRKNLLSFIAYNHNPELIEIGPQEIALTLGHHTTFALFLALVTQFRENGMNVNNVAKVLTDKLPVLGPLINNKTESQTPRPC